MTSTDATVLIPTYNRPQQLLDCVQSVLDGATLPHEVVLVHRRGDDATVQVIDELAATAEIPVIKAWVEEPGHIPPIQEGLRHCSTELTCLLDDDTEVEDDWLDELIAPFEDPAVGVVGGPAVVPEFKDRQSHDDAGQLRFYGETGGGLMWLTEGDIREVDTVAEGNSAWRTDLLRKIDIPDYLYKGDSKFYGLYLTLSVQERAYKIMFNPEAMVWHYPGERDASLDRTNQEQNHWLSSRNYALIALQKMKPSQAFLYYVYAFLIGRHADIGVLEAVRMLLKGDEKWRYMLSCWRGRAAALRSYFRSS